MTIDTHNTVTPDATPDLFDYTDYTDNTSAGLADALARNATLVRCVRRARQFKRLNRATTREVEEQHGQQDAGQWVDKLVHKRYLTAINAAMSAAYAAHARNTVRFELDGAAVLPARNRDRYFADQQAAREQLTVAIDDLRANWDEALVDAQQRLTSSYDPTLYPTADQLGDLWSIETYEYPVPSMTGFIAEVDDDARRSIARDLSERMAAVTASAQYEIYRRLLDAIRALADGIRDYDQGRADGARKHLSGAWLKNLASIAELVPALNITQDPSLDTIAERVQKELLKHTRDELLHSETERKRLAKAARKLEREAAQRAQMVAAAAALEDDAAGLASALAAFGG